MTREEKRLYFLNLEAAEPTSPRNRFVGIFPAKHQGQTRYPLLSHKVNSICEKRTTDLMFGVRSSQYESQASRTHISSHAAKDANEQYEHEQTYYKQE